MTQLKKILLNKPEIGDKAVYNYSLNYNQNPPIYEDSTSLPENNDKFQNKDLFTKSVGNKINEDIVEKNLKFEGQPTIKIDNLYISNAGVDGTVKNNQVVIYLFSEAAYGGDPTRDSYTTIKNKMNENSSDWIIYNEGFGNKSEGTDIGNLDKVEGVDIISNFSANSTQIELGDLPGRTLDIDDSNTNASIPSNIKSFELSSVTVPADINNLNTKIFDEANPNPIYLIIYTRGDKKVAWPVNTDDRRRKYSIFKISNEDLFIGEGDTFQGTNYLVNFTSPTKVRTGEGGSGATKSAWSITSLQIQINTTPGVENNFSDVSNYQSSLQEVLLSIPINENIFNTVNWLAVLNPKNQLNNNNESGGGDTLIRHPDFNVITRFGISENENYNLNQNYVDLQSYYDNLDLIVKSSTPLTVTMQVKICSPSGPDIYPLTNSITDGIRNFYYFVIDWDDKNDRIKTLDDFMLDRPVNEYEYLEKINQNLYKIYKLDENILNNYPFTADYFGGIAPTNVYTTPGIKNVKFVIFSVFDGSNTLPEFNFPNFEVGRWKLCTSRIYLDIPPNQYPDFSNVGGSDYTTIPWPYTTPIIGGVDSNSKYKTSVQNTLSGGNIGDFDIIDEKFLINDLENDEMGKSIKNMDLEQCRFFNKPYGINNLLGINVITNGQYRPYNYKDDQFFWDGKDNKYSEETSVGEIFIGDNLDVNLKQSCNLELNMGEITEKTILDSSGNSNKGLLIGDYKVKKIRKGEPMRRDSFVKVAKKTGNTRGAL